MVRHNIPTSITQEDILLKLNQLMKRLHMYSKNSYVLTILPEEDRLDYRKDLEYVEHAINLIKGEYIYGFVKEDMAKLNKVWKKYKLKEYVSYA